MNLDLVFGDADHAHLRKCGLLFGRFVIPLDQTIPYHPPSMTAAAGETPLPADAIPPPFRCCPAARHAVTSNKYIRCLKDGLDSVIGKVSRGEAGQPCADHQAPAGRTVGSCNFLKNLNLGYRVSLRSTQRLRDQQRKQPGSREGIRVVWGSVRCCSASSTPASTTAATEQAAADQVNV